jgi:DNA-directed RNA polymerase sigma subunit (sigma70/sigma32)
MTLKQRQMIFKTLVDLQDRQQMSIPDTIRQVSEQFGITEMQVRHIQDEGIDSEWPPLNQVRN